MTVTSDLNAAVKACGHLKDPRMKASLGYARALAKAVDAHLGSAVDVGDVVKLSATLLPQYSNALSALGLSSKDLLAREQAAASVQRTLKQTEKLSEEVEQLQKRNAGMVPVDRALSAELERSETASVDAPDELQAIRARRHG